MFDVLHLSDLHIHNEKANRPDMLAALETVWEEIVARESIRGQRFDFVVLSGDLTFSGEVEEFEGVKEFIDKYLVPILKNSACRKRIILVPGNHDLQRLGHSYFETIFDSKSRKLSKNYNEQDAKKLINTAMRGGAEKDLRIEINSSKRIIVREITELPQYAARFANFQRFIDDFYCDQEVEFFKPFDMTSVCSEGNDWSVHIFKEEQILFLGLNSCHRLDGLYTGPHFNPAAIASAAKYIQDNRLSKYLIVAVWHHGLESLRGRFDFICLEDLMSIQAKLTFALGLYGHTHKGKIYSLPEVSGNTFVVAGTGSVSARWNDRPDAVPNQFSTYKITHTACRSNIFSKIDGQYQAGLEEYHPLDLDRQRNGNATMPLQVARNERSWEVDRFGISYIRLKLRGIEILRDNEYIPFATILPEFYSKTIRDEFQIEGDPQPHYIQPAALLNGLTLLRSENSYPKGSKVELAEYMFSVPNRVIFGGLDAFNRNQLTTYPALRGFEVIGHHVNVATFTLAMNFNFEGYLKAWPERLSLNSDNVSILVEKVSQEFGSVKWVPNPGEQDRVNNSAKVEIHEYSVKIEIPSPRVGFRYSLKYKIATSDTAIEEAATDRNLFNDKILGLKKLPGAKHLNNLAKPIDKIIESYIKDEESNSAIEWSCFLWNNSMRLLEPVFGRFPVESWLASFAYGEGLAGHSMRFGKMTGWSNHDSLPTSLLFKVTPITGRSPFRHYERNDAPAQERVNYRWILCLPIIAPVTEERGDDVNDPKILLGNVRPRIAGVLTLNQKNSQLVTPSKGLTELESYAKLLHQGLPHSNRNMPSDISNENELNQHLKQEFPGVESLFYNIYDALYKSLLDSKDVSLSSRERGCLETLRACLPTLGTIDVIESERDLQS